MIFLAIRHLLARKRQSIVTLLGIFIGTTAFIVISGFFQGIQDLITDALVSGDAHIKIQARERSIDREEVEHFLFPEYTHFHWIRVPAGRRASAAIDNPNGWFERFPSEPDVTAATSVYNTTALVNSNQTVYSLSITGMRPSEQVKVTNIESKMVEGSLLDLEKGTGMIVIGKELADELAKQVGDVITLTNTSSERQPFKIVGIFSTGNKFGDRSAAYVRLQDAQKLAHAAGKVSQISVKVANFREASAVANNWKATSFDKVESWDQSNENLLSMFRSQDITRYTVTGIIMLVAGFGIYNILNMVVNQKRKDIAILRSMGYEARDIVRLFLFQGLILGVTGGLLGCLVGWMICVGIGDIHMGGPSAGSFRIGFDFVTNLKALAISNGSALLASILPARAASKLSPIEIIRSGAE